LGNNLKPVSRKPIKLHHTTNVRGEHISKLKITIGPKWSDYQLVPPAITTTNGWSGGKLFPVFIINDNLCTLLNVAQGDDNFSLPVTRHICPDRSNAFDKSRRGENNPTGNP
jgi:hypothetical protein